MVDLHEQESEFLRLLQSVPLDDAPRAEYRNRLREQALALFDRAEQSHGLPWWKRAWNERREIMKRPIPRLIALSTACLMIATVWLLVPGGQSTAQAFNKFAEKLVAAKSARFRMEVAIEGQPKRQLQAYYLAPGRFRQEFQGLDAVNIMDMPAGKIVNIVPSIKRVTVMNVKTDGKDQKYQSQFDRLRQLLATSGEAEESQYKPLGEQEIDGHRAVGFRFDSPSAMVTLWGDPETGHPVRIETVWSGIPRTEVAMTDFEIDVELKQSLFDLTPPAGYKVLPLDIDVGKSDEEALIKAFKTASDLVGGEFPGSLDTAGVQTLIIKHAIGVAIGGKPPTDEDIQQLMKESVVIGVGIQFALELPESADAHYAGKGVKRDEKDKPIFWYKPVGTEKYRVIFADLSVKDAESAPQVPDAQRIENTSKASKPTSK